MQVTPGKSTEGIPQCKHNEDAVVCEVRKEGKNKGRPFWTCRRPPGHPQDPEARCGYFNWADEKRKHPKCECGEFSKVSCAKKEGPNQGKWFYCCSKNRFRNPCSFFAWADQLNDHLMVAPAKPKEQDNVKTKDEQPEDEEEDY
jgi:hypothetical protein